MRMRINTSVAYFLTVAAMGCGQGPAFNESQGVKSLQDDSGGGGETSDSGTPASAGDPVPIMIDEHGNVIKTVGTADAKAGGTTTGTTTKTVATDPGKTITAGPGQIFKIPSDVSDDDAAALQNCVVKWKDNLPARFATYRRTAAQVSVMGYGTALNDTLRTTEPSLILVVAAVNVGGKPVYNLLNPNGYYCVKVGVNVLTALEVNLNCAAHLSDSKVNVNVGSTVNNTTAGVGVAVMSTITVNNQSQAGDVCIR